MQSNIVKSELVEGKVVEQLEPIVLQASIQVVVPTEKELFCIIIEKIQQLDRSIVGTKEDISNLTNVLNEIQKKIPSESSLRYLSVKELANRYSISESQQKQLRGRVKDSLPYYQDGIGGKIKYKVSEIDEWVKSQKVKRGI